MVVPRGEPRKLNLVILGLTISSFLMIWQLYIDSEGLDKTEKMKMMN